MSLQLQLSFELPPSYHLTKGANSSFQAYTSGKNASGTPGGPQCHIASVNDALFHSPKLKHCSIDTQGLASAMMGVCLDLVAVQAIHCSL